MATGQLAPLRLNPWSNRFLIFTLVNSYFIPFRYLDSSLHDKFVPPVCRKSMDSLDSLDIYYGLSGQSGQCPWMSPWTKSSETSQTGQCPWIQWTLSKDSVDTVHGLRGQSGHCSWTKSRESRRTGQCQSPWTMSTESMDNVHWVNGLTGHCPWTHWTKSSLI